MYPKYYSQKFSRSFLRSILLCGFPSTQKLEGKPLTILKYLDYQLHNAYFSKKCFTAVGRYHEIKLFNPSSAIDSPR